MMRMDNDSLWLMLMIMMLIVMIVVLYALLVIMMRTDYLVVMNIVR